MTADTPKCELCGEPMPAGEEMFKYHGYSGPCPKPPIPKDSVQKAVDRITNALIPFSIDDCRIALRRALTALGEPSVHKKIELPECTCFRDGITGPEFNNCIKRCRAFPDRNGDGTTKQDDIKFNRQWGAENMRTCPRCKETIGELEPDGCRDPDCPFL